MEKLLKISLAFSGTLLCLFILAGCTGETSGPFGDTPEVHEGAVGTTECFSCHADGAIAGLANVVGDSDSTKATGWLWGPHGNNETDLGNHIINDNSPNNRGFPNYGYGGLGQDPDCTTVCHDPLGDGELLDDFFAETGSDTLGRLERPVVGCESCHGSGESHFGIGPIANAVPGPEKCGECHNSTFDHNTYHPEGDDIYEDYQASLHNSSTGPFGSPDVEATCSRCHTNEGARQYIGLINGTESMGFINATLGGLGNITGASAVQCRTCHDSHNPHRLIGEETQGLPSTWSAEFKTCTACHQLYGISNTLIAAYHDPLNPDGDSARIINDTHYDDPSTVDIEGYIINTASTHSPSPGNANGGTCLDCHNPHDADTAINGQWARSAHGGFINTNGVVTEAEGPAWVHYDFKTRSSCARCHTSTGFRNFANDPVNYVPANNVFTAAGEQREMLYCWACHSSNAGNLRDAYLFVNTSPYTEPAGRIANVPDLKGSNVCMACHSGRSSGAQIASSAGDFKSKSFTNSHYLAAGGTLFRTIGYEFYADPYYDNETFYMHDRIGETGSNTGENGPCAGCHMRSEEGHTFEPVTYDDFGAISNIPSYEETCSVCHSGKAGLTGLLNSLKTGYEAALDVLNAGLASNNFIFAPAHPYFYNAAGYDPGYDESTASPHCQKNLPVKNWQTGGTSAYIWDGVTCVSSVAVQGTPGTGPHNMGAAFNFNLLHHEPGAYAHNSLYTRRLIFDSIDWLEDGTLNGSIGIANAAAVGYLGSTRP